jgi:glutamate racemase
MSDPRPIGVFDSGLGGLTSVRELFRVLPNESVVYFGDTARLPYGSKSRETVIRFSLEISAFLLQRRVKCLLVACNTASSHALETLTGRLEVPVIGVIEPAARAATARRAGAAIGLIGTLGTVASGAYERAIAALDGRASVTSRACPLFVPLIEEGWFDHAVTRMVAETYLADLRARPLDALILGCTHYPMIAPLIQDVMGPGVALIDSGAEAARATAALLRERGALSDATAPEHHFYLSDEPRNFGTIARAFLGRDLTPTRVVDLDGHPGFETAPQGATDR